MKRLIIAISSIVLILAAGTATFLVLRMFDAQNTQTSTGSEPSTPNLTATIVVDGLEHPWDIDFLPNGTALFTERPGTISKIMNGEKTVIESLDDVNAQGEGGLMGIAVDPDYDENKYIYACYNSARDDVRVVRWEFDGSELSEKTDIVTGIPTADSGRHSGCQTAFGPDGNLWIGTGDAADEAQPQDQAKLGGKILRLTRDGTPASGNPEGPDKRVFSYGHRNTQALAFYPALQDDSYGVSIEHGPSQDDEVNELKPGNFGWAPGEGYDESVPMTDTAKFPLAIEHIWTSGNSTIAPSGAAFLRGEAWGRLEGWLAVSVLKDQKLMLLNVSNGSVNGARVLFEGKYGRLRAATLGTDGALYVSTDNGSNDAILKIVPTQP
ncbi:MAG: PQQ-dependent sugar dehydrogenase [Patescibacteria group bacterium]